MIGGNVTNFIVLNVVDAWNQISWEDAIPEMTGDAVPTLPELPLGF